MKLKLYLLTQNDNTDYDTYDSCVVVAKSEDDARKIHPYGDVYSDISKFNEWQYYTTWTKNPEKVSVQYLGVADKSLKENEVICSSFNAG
jgi:hypothetical protein